MLQVILTPWERRPQNIIQRGRIIDKEEIKIIRELRESCLSEQNIRQPNVETPDDV
jgi:hypothetical protein